MNECSIFEWRHEKSSHRHGPQISHDFFTTERHCKLGCSQICEIQSKNSHLFGIWCSPIANDGDKLIERTWLLMHKPSVGSFLFHLHYSRYDHDSASGVHSRRGCNKYHPWNERECCMRHSMRRHKHVAKIYRVGTQDLTPERERN